ncbi:MAG: hypothetical protein ABI852_00595 [Gemmatimonadaceae bacterium]
MYSTCLFCNASLGANESIEHFPVGRRLAYDAEKGRLWVVCRKCERWNLSPLETRWEAIEEAERAFRSTKLRVSTDNIGMAQLKDGTELVRIGAPPKTEFAAWRYGDQFGKRQRKFFGQVAAAVISGKVVSEIVMSTALITSGSLLSLTGAGAGVLAVGAYGFTVWKDGRLPQFALRDQHGELRRYNKYLAQRAMLAPAGHAFEWQLRIPYAEVSAGGPILRALGVRERVKEGNSVILRDAAAMTALSSLLPTANLRGGSKRAVQDAVTIVNDAPNLNYLLHRASVAQPTSSLMQMNATAGEVAISGLPAELRIALEMSVHEGDERRAMEGELHELELRWKEADAIAKIADEMFLPENMQSTLNELRNDENKTGRGDR